jgi:hypothetical protein
MDEVFGPINAQDDTACLLQAAVLMRKALALLDQAGETRTAAHLQHAIDVLAMRLPEVGQRH